MAHGELPNVMFDTKIYCPQWTFLFPHLKHIHLTHAPTGLRMILILKMFAHYLIRNFVIFLWKPNEF